MVLPGIFIDSPSIEPGYKKTDKERAKTPRGVKISHEIHLTKGFKAMSGERRN
jgi:hypothetical protein